jgi:leucyl-tRNA synthetase
MDFKKTEKKWQDIWEHEGVFKAQDFSNKPKFYGLIEFPYPSGVGLHIGHIKAFSSMEVISRMKRLQGYNVLFPIGWDAFGLPTENFAIKHNIAPRIATDENIANMKSQLKSLGFSFDWSREIDTTDENYYKWTQWIFCQLYKKGLVYRSKALVNYCPTCDVILSNEESQGGVCDRCNSQVVQKEKEVWFLKIRDYADRLLANLDKLDFPERVKEEQRHWIGKSTGAEVNFAVKAGKKADTLTVYTTRPDTLFGVTFMVIAPEHPLVKKYRNEIENIAEVEKYIKTTQTKSEFDRIQVNKDKTGVELKGIKAVNPITHTEVPIFIADYVMMSYGTGAIMAVPAHDTRDFDFAKKFNLQVLPVILGGDTTKEAFTDINDGIMINSGFLNGLNVKTAIKKMIEHLEKNNLGKPKTNYQMKDWAFNRQRYWGEPFPIVYCDKCGTVLVPEKDLPVKLPKVKDYKPSKNGESPLAQVKEWVECTCPKCGGKARRETDTMPQWAGSSWYYLRYMDPHNDKEFASKDMLKYWGPVDWYNGGMEHVTRHLIYSRFWNMTLYDLGLVPFEEPYKKRTTQGLILGEDGNKMSKSLRNVVDPIEFVNKFGADVLRLYTLFMADYESSAPWSSVNINGCKRFLERIERMTDFVDSFSGVHPEHITCFNSTISKVTMDIETLKFNTAISSLMTLVNTIYQDKFVSKEEFRELLILLYPFAPHFAEEMNETLGFKNYICKSPWPKMREDNSVKTIKLPVQINGKMKDLVVVNENATQKEVLQKIDENEKLKALIANGTKKIIFVPNKIINLIV